MLKMVIFSQSFCCCCYFRFSFVSQCTSNNGWTEIIKKSDYTFSNNDGTSISKEKLKINGVIHLYIDIAPTPPKSPKNVLNVLEVSLPMDPYTHGVGGWAGATWNWHQPRGWFVLPPLKAPELSAAGVRTSPRSGGRAGAGFSVRFL